MDLQEYFENAKGSGVLATADGDGVVDAAVYGKPHVMDKETVAFEWVRPAEVLGRDHFDNFFMAPPTFRTLEELSSCQSFSEAAELAASRPIVPILPRRERFAGAMVSVVLPGHPTYPSDRPAPGPWRISLIDGRWSSQS